MTTLDHTMERASEALAKMDYLTCETLCVEALSEARDAGDWAYYGRILMPLQECRRQRRMIAAEGIIRLGTADLAAPVADWVGRTDAGCIVVTHPHTDAEAQQLAFAAGLNSQYVEVLFADNKPSADTWTLRPFPGPPISCELPAPPAAWRNRDLEASDLSEDDARALPGVTPADWFIDASEKLGDVLIEQAMQAGDLLDRIETLEGALVAVTDHELLHQRLGDAVKEARLGAKA